MLKSTLHYRSQEKGTRNKEGGITCQMLLRYHAINSNKRVVGTLGGGGEQGQWLRSKRKVRKEGRLISRNQLWRWGENSGMSWELSLGLNS